MKIPKILYERIELFFKTTSLHGLKYIGQPVASKIERIFWFLSFVAAAGFAGYFINTMFYKFYNNRVIVSINSKSLPTSMIPFPTVTICNMNRANKIRAQAFMQNGSELEKQYVQEFCDFNNTHTAKRGAADKQFSKDEFINFVLQISPSCNEMLKICKWQLEKVDCNSLFTTILTDVGACCSFNKMPVEYVLRNPTTLNTTHVVPSDLKIEDWNFEKGYLTNLTKKRYPRSLKGLGLSVVLDTDVNKYYCSSSNSVGFKLAVTNPTEMPRIKNFAINIFPGIETTISISPVITDSTQDLQSIHINNRQCYFTTEKYLMFYRTYTINNCITECEANYTLKICGCLPYFLRANSSTQVCQKEHKSCMDEVLELVAINEEPLGDKSKCKCLPSCSELNFSKHISYGRLTNTFNNSEIYIKNLSTDYFVENMIVLNIYHPSTSTGRFTKSEIYGQLELLANVGGLLAIFLGFSLLNAAEIVYHLICRILPIIIHSVYVNFRDNRKIFPFTK